jgi:hypothetical protein
MCSVLDMARRFDAPSDHDFGGKAGSCRSRLSMPPQNWSPPASPVTPPPASPPAGRTRPPTQELVAGTPVQPQPQQPSMLQRNASGAGSSSEDASFVFDHRATPRTISAPIAIRPSGSRNSGFASRQVSSMAAVRGAGSHDAQPHRKTSFAQEMSRHVRSWTRRDSEDSFKSMASEPVSYSAQTYVASDIWLAERKLDLVEDGILDREEKKASRRRARAADVFSVESESQDFSSRIVRMLWANPVAHNPAATSCPPEPRSLRSRRNARGQYRVQEKGNLASGRGPSPHYLNPGMPHSKSAVGTGGQDFLAQPGFDPSYPDAGGNAYESGGSFGRRNAFRRVVRKADFARWVRYRANLRAERRNVL